MHLLASEPRTLFRAGPDRDLTISPVQMHPASHHPSAIGSVAAAYLPRARSIARTTACALFRHSCHSLSATESATIPAPA